MIYELTLPKPSNKLLLSVEDHFKKLSLDLSRKQWLDEFNNNKINAVPHDFAVVPELQQLVNEEYGNFFKYDLFAAVGVMKNLSENPACLPPHIDRGRTLAINYYIELGGDKVSTCFYDIEAPTARTESINLKYTQVNKKQEIVFQKNKWYAYDVCVAHSVENIIDTRLFLILGVLTPAGHNNYRVKDLVADNQNNACEFIKLL